MRNFSKNGKLYGQLGDDNVFRKKVSARKHLMRRYNAWGIDRDVYEVLPDDSEIRILDTDTNTVYSISKLLADERRIIGEFGFGEQAFINRELFSKKSLPTP